MNNYITGATIKMLREKQQLTQSQLADKLCVSDKTISKWETGKGFPDISLLEPLASLLRVSLPELLSGEQIINQNRSANILKSNIYVCPILRNIFTQPPVLLWFRAAGLYCRRRKQRKRMRPTRCYAKK